jgi:hypothetical protein
MFRSNQKHFWGFFQKFKTMVPVYLLVCPKPQVQTNNNFYKKLKKNVP